MTPDQLLQELTLMERDAQEHAAEEMREQAREVEQEIQASMESMGGEVKQVTVTDTPTGAQLKAITTRLGEVILGRRLKQLEQAGEMILSQ